MPDIGEGSTGDPQAIANITEALMAYSHTEATLPDGSRLEANTRVTNIWRNGPGGWKAIHEHSSVPVDALTGSGDLKQPI